MCPVTEPDEVLDLTAVPNEGDPPTDTLSITVPPAVSTAPTIPLMPTGDPNKPPYPVLIYATGERYRDSLD